MSVSLGKNVYEKKNIVKLGDLPNSLSRVFAKQITTAVFEEKKTVFYNFLFYMYIHSALRNVV